MDEKLKEMMEEFMDACCKCVELECKKNKESAIHEKWMEYTEGLSRQEGLDG